MHRLIISLATLLMFAAASQSFATTCCGPALGGPQQVACDQATGTLTCEYRVCTEFRCTVRIEAWFDCAVCPAPYTYAWPDEPYQPAAGAFAGSMDLQRFARCNGRQPSSAR
jgi:hypothetical protein